MMLLMVSYPLIFKTFHIGLKAAVVVTILCALAYIWTRPSEASLVKNWFSSIYIQYFYISYLKNF